MFYQRGCKHLRRGNTQAVSESVVDDPFQDLVIDEDQSKSKITESKTAVDRLQVHVLSKAKKRRLRRQKLAKSEGDPKSETAGMDSRPNYLIAMQITNPQIYAAIQRVQEHVISQNESLVPSLQPIGLMHFSLFMIRLDTEEEVTRAKRALDQCKLDLGQLYRDHLISLDISGLDNFRDKVVFAKLKTEAQETRLKGVADIIEGCFKDQGIVSATDHGFTAHATVINLSRDKNSKRRGGVKKIEPALYKKYVNTDFGCQDVNSLQLCPMMKPKLKSGYYDVEYTVQFGPDIIRDNSRALAPDLSEGSELPGESPEKKIRTNNRSEYNEAPFENSASGTSTIKNTDDREHNHKVPDRYTKMEDDPDYEYNSKLSWC